MKINGLLKDNLNFNTVLIGVLSALVVHGLRKIDAGLDHLQRVAQTQAIYVPKVDALEKEMGTVNGEVMQLQEHEREQDKEIDRIDKAKK